MQIEIPFRLPSLNQYINECRKNRYAGANMKKNIDKTFGLIYSQRVMLTLINKGMVREEAYDIVQPKAMESWETQTPFRTLVEQDSRITELLDAKELDECFDENHHLNQVDTIFKRAGIE